MAGYDPYAGHYAHLPGTTPPPQSHPVHSLAQPQPYDDRTDPLLSQPPQDPFATPSYQLRDEPTWPNPAATGDLADGPGHHHHQGGTFVGGVGAGTSLYPGGGGGQYHPYDNHQQNMSYDYLQNQQLQQGPGGGGGTYDDDQAPLLSHGQQQGGGLGWSTSGPAPGQADPSLQLPGGFDPTQQGPYGPPPPQPSPGFGGPGFGGQQGPQQGYDDDAVVRYGRIPQRQPRRYKTVKRQSSSPLETVNFRMRRPSAKISFLEKERLTGVIDC